jgi:sugar phosphate isomerase/epimerase
MPDPDDWIAALRARGYSAAYSPLKPRGGDDLGDANVARFRAAAEKADIRIAEVGAWSNPLSADAEEAKAAIRLCQTGLDLADRIGALCCVNIAGSRNPERWDGPHDTNFSVDTFERIVETTREIIDAVRPKRAVYSLEPMPWIFPSTPDEYRALLKAIDRPGMGVHLDVINMIDSPRKVYDTASLIRECFDKLGPYIQSCHIKDISLSAELTVHLAECRPGLGVFDHRTLLREADRLGRDFPIMLEHLPADQYAPAADFIRGLADEIGVEILTPADSSSD